MAVRTICTAIVSAIALWVVTADAQQSPPAAMDVNNPPQLTKLSPEAVSFQKQSIEELEQRARLLARGNPAKYNALLRSALGQISVQSENVNRGLQGNARSIIAALNPDIEPTAEDRDPVFRRRIARLIELSKIGIRMVGAEPVERGRHLQTVALLSDNEQVGCTGVLVAPGAVLTAAHCVCALGLDQSARDIVFGEEILNPLKTVRSIAAQTRIFPRTTLQTPSAFCAEFALLKRVCRIDLALVRFNPVDAPPNVQPVKVASFAEVSAAQASVDTARPLRVEVVGFGASQVILGTAGFSYHDAGVKRAARFSFYWQCGAGLPLNCSGPDHPEACIPFRELNIADTSPRMKDSCAGDSGGPAFVETKGGELKLAALVSRALRRKGDCGPGGVYSYVHLIAVTNWLQNNGVKVER